MHPATARVGAHIGAYAACTAPGSVMPAGVLVKVDARGAGCKYQYGLANWQPHPHEFSPNFG